MNNQKEYKIWIPWEAKSDPKGFFQLHTTTVRNIIKLLNTACGESTDSGKDTIKAPNEYSLLYLRTQENQMVTLEVVFMEEKTDKSKDVIITTNWGDRKAE